MYKTIAFCIVFVIFYNQQTFYNIFFVKDNKFIQK